MSNVSPAEAVEAIRRRMGSSLCVMGHHYQADAVVAHCDITGDSLELSRRVADVEAEHIVFCGVHFMGESAALLTRSGQKVHLPAPEADCEMARMSPADGARAVLEDLASRGIRCLPLAYVNTSLALKAAVGEWGGAVCTSSNASVMLKWALDRADHVLFLPDRNLGRNTALRLGLSERDWHALELDADGRIAASEDEADLRRRLLLWPGFCPIHDRIPADAVRKARAAHPGCRVVAHPECAPDLIGLCDAAGSTSLLIGEAERMAAEPGAGTLIVGTEINLVNRLAARHAGRCDIHPLTDDAVCGDMALVTEERLLACLKAVEAGTAVPLEVDPALRDPARATLTRMLDVCA